MRRLICGVVIAAVFGIAAYDLSLAGAWWKTRQTHARVGFTARQTVDANGEEFGYVLFVPHELPKGTRPALLMFLNGFGENGKDGVIQIERNFGEPTWEFRRRFPMICLAPQCRNNWAPGSPDTVRAMALLDQVVAEYDVDVDRIYLTGVSAGGSGTWNIASAYPGKFAAIVPLCGMANLSPPTVAKSFGDPHVGVWNFFNDGDDAGLVRSNRALRESFIEAGLSPIFIEYHRTGHDAWNAGYRTAAMYEWLSQQSRTANAERCGGGRFQRLLADQSGFNAWRAKGSGRWAVADGVLRCEGSPEDERQEFAFDADLADFELHFDYRSPSNATCQLLLESVDAPDERIRIAIDAPERGSGGVLYEPTGERLGVSDPIAQRAMNPGRWNDIRISRRDDILQLSINGARLHEVKDHRVAGSSRIAFVVPPGVPNDREWRLVRLWQRRAMEPSRPGE